MWELRMAICGLGDELKVEGYGKAVGPLEGWECYVGGKVSA